MLYIFTIVFVISLSIGWLDYFLKRYNLAGDLSKLRVAKAIGKQRSRAVSKESVKRYFKDLNKAISKMIGLQGEFHLQPGQFGKIYL